MFHRAKQEISPLGSAIVQVRQTLAGRMAQSPCPICGGVLIPLRGTSRCTSCGFSLCEDCGAESDTSNELAS
jgi:hypothetical protein